jgi:peptide/nickel transport system substrate-binding protein
VLEPDLASSWAQTNPVTYVYHLRHGVKFWDGDDLTADDVV